MNLRYPFRRSAWFNAVRRILRENNGKFNVHCYNNVLTLSWTENIMEEKRGDTHGKYKSNI